MALSEVEEEVFLGFGFGLVGLFVCGLEHSRELDGVASEHVFDGEHLEHECPRFLLFMLRTNLRLLRNSLSEPDSSLGCNLDERMTMSWMQFLL